MMMMMMMMMIMMIFTYDAHKDVHAPAWLYMYRSVRLPGTVDTNGTLTVDESPGNALLLYLQALTHHVRFRIGRIRVGTAIYVGLALDVICRSLAAAIDRLLA